MYPMKQQFFYFHHLSIRLNFEWLKNGVCGKTHQPIRSRFCSFWSFNTNTSGRAIASAIRKTSTTNNVENITGFLWCHVDKSLLLIKMKFLNSKPHNNLFLKYGLFFLIFPHTIILYKHYVIHRVYTIFAPAFSKWK